VELAAADRPDDLGVVAAIAQQLLLAVRAVHHAAAHHHGLVEHRAIRARGAQRVQAAFGERQVDRAPARVPAHARIAPALEHIDRPAALREQRGEQAAGKAGPDDGEVARAHAPSRHASVSFAKRRMSARVLYSGAGEMRMTSGSRQSPSTPRVARNSNSARPAARPVSPRPCSTRNDNCAPRRSGSRGVTICNVSDKRARINCSRYAVSSSERARNLSMPALANRSSDARSGASPRIGGLLNCQPSAPGVGTKLPSMRKREAWSWPHHPAKRGRVVFAWRACTKQPATAPGPEFMYL